MLDLWFACAFAFFCNFLFYCTCTAANLNGRDSIFSEDSSAEIAAIPTPIPVSDIAFSGFLRVRCNHGIPGLRRWLERFFVLSRSDRTLYRFHSRKEASSGTTDRKYRLDDMAKIIKVYVYSGWDLISNEKNGWLSLCLPLQELPPRFSITFRQQLPVNSIHTSGVAISPALPSGAPLKLAAESELDSLLWIRALSSLLIESPLSAPVDPVLAAETRSSEYSSRS